MAFPLSCSFFAPLSDHALLHSGSWATALCDIPGRNEALDRLTLFWTFVRAYEVGSFSLVGREVGISQSAISKQIAQLEAHLGVQLFVRSTRRLRPTYQAEQIYDQVRRGLDILGAVEGWTEQGAIRGVVRVTAPESFAIAEIIPRLPRFTEHYPDVTISLHVSDETVDLISLGFEVGIRIGRLGDSALKARRIGTLEHMVVASADYVAKFGEPRVPGDLAQHRCVIYSSFLSPHRWEFDSEFGHQVVDVAGSVHVNTAESLAAAALSGAGVAVMPDWLLKDAIADGRVIRVLRDYVPPRMPIHMVHPPTRWLSPCAEAFTRFIEGELSAPTHFPRTAGTSIRERYTLLEL